MDQDSGQRTGRSVPQRDGRARAQIDEKPPSEMAGALPRRSAQRHMEPQLRRPRSAGTGTAFTPFTPTSADATPAEDDPAPTTPDESTPATAVESSAAATANADDGDSSSNGDSGGNGNDDSDDDQAAEGSRATEFRDGAVRGRKQANPPAG